MKKTPLFLAALIVLALPVTLAAQATRTWVSGTGDDANPCSRTAPCKTFAGAISKTAANGEINALDPGGYGAVTINKSLTIDGSTIGSAGIVVSGTSAIIINAGVNDVVELRNLSINGLGNSAMAIRVLAAKTVIIESCNVWGFTQRGVSVETSADVNLIINNSTIRNSGIGVVTLASSGTPVMRSALTNVRLTANSAHGIYVAGGSQMTVRDSTISLNGVAGVFVDEPTGSTELNLESTILSGNLYGIYHGGGTPTTRISNVSIFNNASASIVPFSGSVISYRNNRIDGNGTATGPTSSVPEQ